MVKKESNDDDDDVDVGVYEKEKRKTKNKEEECIQLNGIVRNRLILAWGILLFLLACERASECTLISFVFFSSFRRYRVIQLPLFKIG